MRTRRTLLALVGIVALGLAAGATAVVMRQTRAGDRQAAAVQNRLETVTLTIRGML